MIGIVATLDFSMAKKFGQALSHLKKSFPSNGAYSVDKTLMIDELSGLVDEWISVDKDIQANKYGLSKMLVCNEIPNINLACSN